MAAAFIEVRAMRICHCVTVRLSDNQPAGGTSIVLGRLESKGIRSTVCLTDRKPGNQSPGFAALCVACRLAGNYLAPTVSQRMILDVGSGTGRWCFDMTQTFPTAQVF